MTESERAAVAIVLALAREHGDAAGDPIAYYSEAELDAIEYVAYITYVPDGSAE